MGLSRMLQAPSLLEFPKPTRQEDQNTSEQVECPRCGSYNTKFCYYNNYNKSQPRHFCKSCKRHWTKGGTLRNVPVGGGRNKNKRIKITSKRGIEKAEKKSPNLQKRNDFSDDPTDCSNINLIPESISMAEDSFYPRNHHQDLKFPFLFSDSCSFDADPSCSFQASTVTYSFNGEITEDPRIADIGTYSWNWDDFDGLVSPDFNLSLP